MEVGNIIKAKMDINLMQLYPKKYDDAKMALIREGTTATIQELDLNGGGVIFVKEGIRISSRDILASWEIVK